MSPYFFWHTNLSTIYVRTILAFILALMFFKNRYKWSSRDTSLFFLLLVSLIIYTISGGNNLNHFIALLPCVFLPFSNNSFAHEVFDRFLNIYVVIIAISLISWALVILGVMPPMGTILPLSSGKTYNYFVYPLLVSAADGHSLRFFGPFDEPGVVGTTSGIMLCIEKFDLKNRKSIILLISGLCSLSFFFYILVTVYFLIYYSLRQRSIPRTIFTLLLMIGAFYVINKTPFLYEEIGSRFVWDSSSGKFSGDNRIDNEIIAQNFHQMVGTNQFWWGINNKEQYLEEVAGSASFLTIVIVNGILFTILYLMFYVLYGLNYKKKGWWPFILYLFVVLGTLYQRPWVFDVYYIFLFTYLARTEQILKQIPNYGKKT